MTGADVKFVGDITGQEGISLENVKVISDTKIKAIAPKIPDEKDRLCRPCNSKP